MRRNTLTGKLPAGETGVGALFAIRGPDLIELFVHLGPGAPGDLLEALRA